MEGIKSLTGIYYLGIGCGLWNKVEVIEWCDKLIEVSDNPLGWWTIINWGN